MFRFFLFSTLPIKSGKAAHVAHTIKFPAENSMVTMTFCTTQASRPGVVSTVYIYSGPNLWVQGRGMLRA